MTAKKDGKKKQPKREPLPLIGVRNSNTAISAPKVLALGVGVAVTAIPNPGEKLSALDHVIAKEGGGLKDALVVLERRVRTGWADGSGKVAAALFAGLILFGKRIDRRLKGFGVKFGG